MRYILFICIADLYFCGKKIPGTSSALFGTGKDFLDVQFLVFKLIAYDEIRTTNIIKGGNGCALSVAGVISLLVLSNLWTPFFFLGGILLIVGVIILGWTAINKQDDDKETHEMSKKISELSKESKNLKSKYDDLNKQISLLSVKR